MTPEERIYQLEQRITQLEELAHGRSVFMNALTANLERLADGNVYEDFVEQVRLINARLDRLEQM